MLETQLRDLLPVFKYHCFQVRLNGRPPVNPRAQDAATCDIRIFAQAKGAADLSYEKFLRPVMDNIMQAYPGALDKASQKHTMYFTLQPIIYLS
jgi:type VI protein secretion system component VasK